ncbi:hypothetical protein MBANPS3_005175, partial [Mucor bainieri]
MEEKPTDHIEVSHHHPNYNYASSTEDTITHENNVGRNGTYGETDVNQVNVQGAKNEYQTLKRELSQMSRKSTTPSKTEEGQADSDDFNLDDFLHGIHREQEENGQKRKHLGVSWKNLHVEGLGADAYTIPTVFSNIMTVLKFWKLFKKKEASTK